MAVRRMSRRFIAVGGFAVAIAAAPLGFVAGFSGSGSTHAVADGSSDASGMTSCSTTQDSGSYALQCRLSAPLPSGAAGGNGTLSEQAITAQNHH